MNDPKILLTVARDEIDTLIKYYDMQQEALSEPTAIKPIMDEIMGDEFNHALIALLSAAKLMNIQIATDDLSEDPNDIEVE